MSPSLDDSSESTGNDHESTGSDLGEVDDAFSMWQQDRQLEEWLKCGDLSPN